MRSVKVSASCVSGLVFDFYAFTVTSLVKSLFSNKFQKKSSSGCSQSGEIFWTYVLMFLNWSALHAKTSFYVCFFNMNWHLRGQLFKHPSISPRSEDSDDAENVFYCALHQCWWNLTVQSNFVRNMNCRELGIDWLFGFRGEPSWTTKRGFDVGSKVLEKRAEEGLLLREHKSYVWIGVESFLVRTLKLLRPNWFCSAKSPRIVLRAAGGRTRSASGSRQLIRVAVGELEVGGLGCGERRYRFCVWVRSEAKASSLLTFLTPLHFVFLLLSHLFLLICNRSLSQWIPRVYQNSSCVQHLPFSFTVAFCFDFWVTGQQFHKGSQA